MMCTLTQFHTPSTNDLLVTAIKLKANCTYRAASMLLFTYTKNHFKRSLYFSKVYYHKYKSGSCVSTLVVNLVSVPIGSSQGRHVGIIEM
jgi:hypothetical protein